MQEEERQGNSPTDAAVQGVFQQLTKEIYRDLPPSDKLFIQRLHTGIGEVQYEDHLHLKAIHDTAQKILYPNNTSRQVERGLVKSHPDTQEAFIRIKDFLDTGASLAQVYGLKGDNKII
jgi:hypothetical protein